ncbi:hypothetical protein [uncultured Polaribacter sp.]|uniref:hypothetical protein n=1 Tax=uncultured Polaribacter sp. TaxID=174711 RepID=UPI002621925B|nr:hypothetical protein [uncultured Polaribacter sp.]
MKKKLTNLLKIGTLFFGVSLILWNCEKNSETIEPVQETIDFTLKPKIENFSLSQLNQDKDFNNLKDNFNILQTKYLSKSNKNSSARLVDTLGITIDANSIKRISYDNYVSYTMLMIEPENTSSNFSNLVIQEYNGVKRIFTVRYLPSQNKSKKSSYSSKSSTESFNGDIQMSSGITTTELWGDDDGGGGGGSGTSNCEEYETVCNTVNVWSSVCGCPDTHAPGVFCTCKKPRIDWVQTIEECEDICIWDNYNDQTGDNNNNSTGGGGNTGNNNNSNPTNVATTPVNPNGITPNEYINNTLSLKSPFNLDVTEILDSISLPTQDTISLKAFKKFKCIYSKLSETNSFKNLFIDTFGDSNKFDVTFKIVDNLASANGQTGGSVKLINGQLNSVDLIIEMNRSKILSRSSIAVARTIIHESIHAYLKLKFRDCNSGATLAFLNNIQLGKLLNEYYTSGQCNSGLGQHGFMMDYMLPVMENCLSEVMNDLIPLSNRNAAESQVFYDQQLGINDPWNWDSFYWFFSMEGLDESNTHLNLIQNNPSTKFLYDKYRKTGSSSFSKDSCPN